MALQHITRKSLEAVISTLSEKYIAIGDDVIDGQSEDIIDQCLRECCGEAAFILSRVASLLELGESIREVGQKAPSTRLSSRLLRIEKRLRGDNVKMSGNKILDDAVNRIHPIAAPQELTSMLQHIMNETNLTVNKKGSSTHAQPVNAIDPLSTNQVTPPRTIEELRDSQQEARARCYRYCQSALPLSSPMTDLSTSNYNALQQQANKFLAEELSEACATKKLAEDLSQVKVYIDCIGEGKADIYKGVVMNPCCKFVTVFRDTVTLDLRGAVRLFIRYNIYEKKWMLDTTSAPGVLLTVYTPSTDISETTQEEVTTARLHSSQHSTIIAEVHRELQKGLSEGMHCALKLACAVVLQFIKMKLDVILQTVPYSSRIGVPRVSINPSREFMCIAFDVSPGGEDPPQQEHKQAKMSGKGVTCKILFDFTRATIIKVVQWGSSEQLKEDWLAALFNEDKQGIFIDIESLLKSLM
eukprot:Tbor_TRINITY_DN3187_c0_g1::TRINITY_DN3187_c0_g1_i1::g.14678::m.14678